MRSKSCPACHRLIFGRNSNFIYALTILCLTFIFALWHQLGTMKNHVFIEEGPQHVQPFGEKKKEKTFVTELQSPWSNETLTIKRVHKNHSDFSIFKIPKTNVVKPENILNQTFFKKVEKKDQPIEPYRSKLKAKEKSVLSWWTPFDDIYLLHIADSYIGDGVIFDKDKYYSMGRHWLGRSSKLYENVNRVVEIDLGVSINAWGGDAFQHFILDALPKLGLIYKWLMKNPQIKIVTHYESRTPIWLWKKLDLTDRIIRKPKNAKQNYVIHCNMCLYVHADMGALGLYPRNALYPIQEKLKILEVVEKKYVLYFSRGGRNKRGIKNEKEMITAIENIFKNTAYEMKTFKHGALDDDMEIIKKSIIIFGPHGGAFANLAFAQPGTHVIEFNAMYGMEKKARSLYWGLAQTAGCHYWNIEPLEWIDYNNPMKINITEITDVMTTIKNLIIFGHRE